MTSRLTLRMISPDRSAAEEIIPVLREIGPDYVLIGNGVGDPRRIANDYVFVFAGGELPTHFLRSCGVKIDTKFGEPQASYARNG